jgi:hypothetical protein
VWSCCSSLLSCLQGRQPLECRVRPEGVVIPEPAIIKELRLWSCGEQLSVEELIAEPPVEQFRESVFQRLIALDLRLIRFGGHIPKGGYGVPNG